MPSEQKLMMQSIAISEVASRVLGLKTLESQNSDQLDFHDLSVDLIRAALIAAYESGWADSRRIQPN